ncbi:hypothetical protein MDAP_002105 [Mitosporidium daphniae]|uniref:Sjogren syndrome antigen B n=1 Tax=Mitosporidium daphniae TaxID=1485682 RepID=A0A098VP90_9MICR|nr:Sjogren syndrome antigen B [Mitosporidium daphniae]KGG50629.1 Sjogren syndrome antigen B [Mitosporidium daphniae]|eukprot:XP_013237056.1 Sjogren syndrome antigen B [Mitosporidium daphniae]
MSISSCSSTSFGEVLSHKILNQIEFYFGDLNLSKDKFLLTKISETAEGWVPISVIADFGRIKAQLNNINEEQEKYAAIKSALSSSLVVEINDQGNSLRRKIPLSTTRDDLKATLYVKGFPKNTSLDELQLFFGKLSEVPFAIRMRRFQDADKLFKGSVYVEFLTEAEVDRFLALNACPPFIDEHGENHPLFLQKKIDHVMKKNHGEKGVGSSPLKEISKDSIIKVSPIPENADWKLIKDELSTKLPISRVVVDSENKIAFALLRGPIDEQSEVPLTWASQALQKCPDIAFGALDSTLSLPSESEYESAISSFATTIGKPKPFVASRKTRFSKRQKVN